MASHATELEMSQSPHNDGRLWDVDDEFPHSPSRSIRPQDDEDSASGVESLSRRRQQEDDWLPVTGSRNAKWWYSTFHNVTAMVGAGVLGLPYAMAFLGWGAGITALTLSWVITLYTLWQMVEMHEMNPKRRLDQYHELGQEAFGKKGGLWLIIPPQLVVQVGLDIVYIVTGGQSLMKFYELIKCPDRALDPTRGHCGHIGPTAWIVIFAAPQFILSQLPNLSSISGLSLAAAIMSLGYSTIAWGDTVALGRSPNVSYHLPNYVSKYTPSRTFSSKPPVQSPESSDLRHLSTAYLVFGVMRSLGVIAFAYGGHNVVLEIQATLPSTPKKPSKVPMWQGVLVAYLIVAMCYFPVAIAGYWAYGNSVSENILFTLKRPRALLAAANMMVAIHVLGSYQLYAMPIYDLLETILSKKFYLPRSTPLRLVTRCSYVFLTGLLACTFPFFGDLLGLFGGLAFAPTTYFLPCIIWLKVYKPKRFGLSWTANYVCIILGTLLALTSLIGGFFYIILHASTYAFYK